MVNSFDEKAGTWDENPRRIKLVESVWNLLKEKIDLGSINSVLDYGCGTGLLGYKTVNNVDIITFCDTSEGMLDQVEKKRDFYNYQNVNILKTDFTADILPKEKFDLILSMLVMHHVKDINSLINKFNEVLNTNGLFCWIDLDLEDGTFHSDNTGIPHFGFSKSSIEKLLSENNFRLINYTDELKIQKEIDGEFIDYALFIVIAKKI